MRALVEYRWLDGGPRRRPQRIDAGAFVEHFRDVTTLEQCVEPQLVVLDGDGASMPEHAARIMHGQVGIVTRLSLRNAREWASARGRLLMTVATLPPARIAALSLRIAKHERSRSAGLDVG